jgi:hypothetical protein
MSVQLFEPIVSFPSPPSPELLELLTSLLAVASAHGEAIRIDLERSGWRVRITVAPTSREIPESRPHREVAVASMQPDDESPLPPCYFSATESAIVEAIGPSHCLLAKNIAKWTGRPCGAQLRLLLRNLKSRGVLIAGGGGQGYRWSEEFRRLRTGEPVWGENPPVPMREQPREMNGPP